VHSSRHRLSVHLQTPTKKNQLVALILASIAVPVINTGLFALGSVIFFQDFLNSGISERFPNAGAFLIFGVIGFNFLIEVVTTAIVSPTVGMILLKREQKTAQ
jgi:membrane-bound ClpP family serine protease